MLPTAPAAPETTTVSLWLDTAHVEEPEVSGQPRHPQRAEVGGRLSQRGIDLAHAPAVRERIFLHAEGPVDVVADDVVRMRGRGDQPDRAGSRDVADLDRRDVGGSLQTGPADHEKGPDAERAVVLARREAVTCTGRR
jgi:hypothetical protein